MSQPKIADIDSNAPIERTIHALLIRKVDDMTPEELQELCTKIGDRFEREPNTTNMIYTLLIKMIENMMLTDIQWLCVKIMDRLGREPNNIKVLDLLCDVHKEITVLCQKDK